MEHASNAAVGAAPEWVDAPRREQPAAFVRNSRPCVRAVFRGTPACDGVYSVGADGGPFQLEERRVSLAFSPATGLSQAVDLRARRRLPDRIGVHDGQLDWFARTPVDSLYGLPAGTSRHRIYTTWQAPTANHARGLPSWAYRQLMDWTCRWCAGQTDEFAICNAIIREVGTSGLSYGVRAHNIREMLNAGGGMCAGWYQMFQHMAHCQGVFVHRRRFIVHWRPMPRNEVMWCAIVIKSGGLNQPHPTHGPSTFHDNDTTFPVDLPVGLQTRTERRYRFRGVPIDPILYGDGHCINFLEYRGRRYLYDAYFARGPVEIDSPLPPDNHSILGGAELSSFKARYLDSAVDYMLGSLYNGSGPGSVFHRTTNATNGMTVRTDLIPDVAGTIPGVTFYWGG